MNKVPSLISVKGVEVMIPLKESAYTGRRECNVCKHRRVEDCLSQGNDCHAKAIHEYLEMVAMRKEPICTYCAYYDKSGNDECLAPSDMANCSDGIREYLEGKS